MKKIASHIETYSSDAQRINLTVVEYGFVANFVSYISAKYYLNWFSFHIVITKVIGVNFFWNTVYTSLKSTVSAQQFSRWQYVGSIFIRLAVVASQTCLLAQNSVKIRTYSSSRSSKVDDFGTNRKRIYDFLLVINSNFGPILHRFWDTATYWLKIAYFSYPSLIRRPAPYLPFGISRWS